ncbi:MAG TPA: GlsB/YeaQ/YmgE family stress response membrane protein [Candidatus Binatia bacterium]|jgi:uncharacterized membrane protein YeaQ/YmgE (transglycosylase-associated protein family)
MGLLSWIIFAGVLARIITRDDPRDAVVTTMIGLAGALIGGSIAVQLGFGALTVFDFRSFAVAILGTLMFLAGYRLVARD